VRPCLKEKKKEMKIKKKERNMGVNVSKYIKGPAGLNRKAMKI
jgi:hypothetical protein